MLETIGTTNLRSIHSEFERLRFAMAVTRWHEAHRSHQRDLRPKIVKLLLSPVRSSRSSVTNNEVDLSCRLVVTI